MVKQIGFGWKLLYVVQFFYGIWNFRRYGLKPPTKEVNEETKILAENESIYIPLGSKHRLINPGEINLTLIEVQCGSYVGEDDIVRFEDKYGR